MSNSVLKLLGALLCVLLLFIYPLLESFQRQDDISNLYAIKSTTQFVDSVREKGYITPRMWDQFMRELSLTGNTFDISMEHYAKTYEPVYDDPTQQATFKSDFLIHYQLTNQDDILKVMYPDNSEPIESSNRRYKLKIGDYIGVKVSNSNRTQATLLLDWLSGTFAPKEKIIVPVGGIVRNEDY
ncbi:hypothetical protein [Paenibacillus thiaminolyticus]|uniref:Uncharacterized protein n=1 Tax=Paenibacillus thiaminolyticus TaxID=49283 RepID=A0A3A3GDK9_PANTH|nr:hypothetical protein [Paenibacillus thiaminolyticus]RJG21348.1 hypothetical protein DQX05_21850 [Paenibacillus thiaminolyticus]